MPLGWPRDHRGIQNIVLGVDWSVTGSEKSYTVVNVLGYDAEGKCYVLYSERMQGINILDQVAKVKEIFLASGAQMIASDRGVGVLQVQLLQQALGANRVIAIQYVSAKNKLRWDNKGQFLAADRTQAIDNVLMKIRLGRKRLETPNWTMMEQFWQHALAVFEEETMSGKRVFRHHPDEPDDWLHALVFGNIGYQFMSGDYTFLE